MLYSETKDQKDEPLKKIFTILVIFTFIFSNAAVFAQMPVTVPGVMYSLGELSKIGVVAAIQGKVEVMTPGAAGRVVQSGEEIFIGDAVKTDALGHLQILLLDETVFTIGPNSAITIDKFVYDPKSHAGNVEASIAKGVFRYVSGKIAANKPENVTIHLPTATIGIRGTIIAGEASASGSMAMLLGPGSRNDSGATIGSFVMNGTGGNSGQQEHVNRTGFGVSVDQAGSLSGVFMVPEAKVQFLSNALLPQGSGFGEKNNDPNASPSGRTLAQGPSGVRPPAGPLPGAMPKVPTAGPGLAPIGPAPMMAGNTFGTGENMGKLSGEQTIRGFETTQQLNALEMLQNNLNQDTTTVSQDLIHNTALQNTNTQTVRDTLKSEMIARVAPIVTYEHYGGRFIFNGLQGTLDAFIKVNFTADNVVGGSSGSRIDINVPNGISEGTDLTDSCFLSNQTFSSIPGNASAPANFQWTNIAGTNGTFTNIEVQFQDIVKQMADPTIPPTVNVAAQANVVVDYSYAPTSDTGTGQIIVPQS